MKIFGTWDAIHKKISNKILLCLKNGKVEETEQIQKIRYALSSVLGELEKCIILCLCFWYLGALEIFFLSLCSVVMLRIFMGGQHRETMLGCFFQSFFTFAIIYILGFYINIVQGAYVVYIVTLVTIWYSTPVLSEKRMAYSKLMQTKFKAKALTSLCVLIMIISLLPKEYGNYCVWSILIQNVDVVGAIVMQKRKKGDATDEKFEGKSM